MYTTAVVVMPVREIGVVYELPVQWAVLETTVTLVTLLAGFLVFGRLRRNSRLNDLVLAAALTVFTLSDLLFVIVPLLMGSATSRWAVLAAITGRSAGALLFIAAAFTPRARIRHPGRAIGLMAASVLGALMVAAVLAHVISSSSLLVITNASDGRLSAAPALVTAEIVEALLACIAAAGYLRRAERFCDEFARWLAIAAAATAGSHASYAINPAIYSVQVSLGDIFRFGFCVILLIGSMREIQSYWRTLASAMVAEERRRFARDLHDGLSQELAYLTRNLSGVQDVIDEKTLRRLALSVDRARLATRQAVRRAAVPARPTVADALTEAADEVADRFGLDLRLDLASGIGMTPTRADALVRIAREALVNVARHSGSRQVSLMLRRHGPRVRLQVRDSGRGFDPAARGDGFGLTSMRERALSVGGEFHVSSELGAGSKVEATL